MRWVRFNDDDDSRNQFFNEFLGIIQRNRTIKILKINTFNVDNVRLVDDDTMLELYEILANKEHFRRLYTDRNTHSIANAHRILGDEKVRLMET